MAGQQDTYTIDEIARLGDELYEQRIRQQVEAGNKGKVLAIDIHTGEYALGDTPIDSGESLRQRCPNAEIWFMRIGSPTLYKIGYFPCREAPASAGRRP